MKSRFPIITLAIFIASLLPGWAFDHFISAHDGSLWDGTRPFRFISWNIPNLLIVEDNFSWNAPEEWRLPDTFELNDALSTVQQLGGTVVRTYSLPIRRVGEDPSIPKYVLGPGQYNETAFQTMDEALKLANDHHIRLIIPFINNWPWQGGRADVTAWRGKPADRFWDDPQEIADFEAIIRHVITRTNSITGIRYADDKAILCWETGNEVRGATVQWTAEIARFIKSLDPHHLVMDGYDSNIRPEILGNRDVDIVTTHQYPDGNAATSLADQVREDAKRVDGRKAYIVGELGFFKTAEMKDGMLAIQKSGISGGLLWSLRFHDRDGGFYWHSEPGGGDLYKAFHWPPSPLNSAYDEMGLMDEERQQAFAIRKLSEPGVHAPPSPRLLPIANPGAISWQGSVGATGYSVERAPTSHGPWTVAVSSVDEAWTQYHPLCSDENVPAGIWYYRVLARNQAGMSAPSSIQGPVVVTQDILVDEMSDFTRMHSKTGGWKETHQNSRMAREDATRMEGHEGDSLIYHVSSPISKARIFAFFPHGATMPDLLVSKDGQNFQKIPMRSFIHFRGGGEYGYWISILYESETPAAGNYLKVKLTGETQIGRLEIFHRAE